MFGRQAPKRRWGRWRRREPPQRPVRRWMRQAFYEKKGAAGKTLINWLIDRWPAPRTLVFPTVIKSTKHLISCKSGIWQQKNMEKNAPQARFLDETIALQAKLMKQIAPQGKFFFTESWCVICLVSGQNHCIYSDCHCGLGGSPLGDCVDQLHFTEWAVK